MAAKPLFLNVYRSGTPVTIQEGLPTPAPLIREPSEFRNMNRLSPGWLIADRNQFGSLRFRKEPGCNILGGGAV
jgi:hypothetical protein